MHAEAGRKAALAVFRADASPEIGGGHVRRCMALAQALYRQGWRCAFVMKPGSGRAFPLVMESGFETVEPEQPDDPSTWIGDFPDCELLIVDHYGLGAEFETSCRPWAKFILAIDDLADRRHDCDALLDATIGRSADDYRNLLPEHCRLLCGSAYALLDARFHGLRCYGRGTAPDGAPRVLVSFGAIDSAGGTLAALEALGEGGQEFEIDVVLGAASPHLDKVRTLIEKMGPPARLHVDRKDMAGLMAEADLAIGACGTTTFERCALGLPSIVVPTADNQKDIAAGLARADAALVLPPLSRNSAAEIGSALSRLASDPALRSGLAANARRLCDGLGATRTLTELPPWLSADDGKPVRLRLARREDAAIMYDWQVTPHTRRFARNPRPPTREGHEIWLAGKLADPGCVFNVILHGESPAGVLRFDRIGEALAYEVSILVAPEKQGLGLGKLALELGRRLMADSEISAEVFVANAAGQKLFESAGYRLATHTYVLPPASGEGVLRWHPEMMNKADRK